MSARIDLLGSTKVSVVKPSGQRIENVDANVQSNMIFFNDPDLPLEAGDVVEHTRGGGITDKFEIIDPGYMAGMEGIPSHFQSKIKRWQAPQAAPTPTPTHVTYNLHGQNSKVNISSVDNSTIYGGNTQTLYQELRKAIESNIPEPDRGEIEQAVSDLEAAGESEKAGAFGRFVAKASNYVEVLTPFIKALGGLIS